MIHFSVRIRRWQRLYAREALFIRELSVGTTLILLSLIILAAHG